jgi:hypothetical protein
MVTRLVGSCSIALVVIALAGCGGSSGSPSSAQAMSSPSATPSIAEDGAASSGPAAPSDVQLGRVVVTLLSPGSKSGPPSIYVYDAASGALVVNRALNDSPNNTFETEYGTLTWESAGSVGCSYGCKDIYSPDFRSMLGFVKIPNGNVVPATVSIDTPATSLKLMAPVVKSSGFSAPVQETIVQEEYLSDGRVIWVTSPDMDTAVVHINGAVVRKFNLPALKVETGQGVTGIAVGPNGTWALIVGSDPNSTDWLLPSGKIETSSDSPRPAFDVLKNETRPELAELETRLPNTQYDLAGRENPASYRGTWAFLAAAPASSSQSLFLLPRNAQEPKMLLKEVPDGVIASYGPWPTVDVVGHVF